MEPIELEKDLMDAVEYAAYSPSSHNSQPWELAWAKTPAACLQVQKFLQGQSSITGNPVSYLILALNRDRHLRALSAHRLEMILSCGIYLESLLIALAARNWSGEVCWYNTGEICDFGLPNSWEALAVVALMPGLHSVARNRRAIESLPLFQARITNRAPYLSSGISGQTLRELTQCECFLDSQIQRETQITLIQSREDIRKVGDFVARHAAIDFSHAAAWQETYRFIHFGPHAIRRAQFGMPVTQLFGPMPPWKQYVYKLLFSPAVMQLLAHTGYLEILGNEFGKLVSSSPVLGYINFRHDEVPMPMQLAGGALIFQMWLQATRLGLALHPVSVILQHPDLRMAFQEENRLPHGRGFFFFRMGLPTAVFPPAPKRKKSWNDVVHLI